MRKLICNKVGCRLEGKNKKMSSKVGAGYAGFHARNSTYLKPFKQANKRKSYTMSLKLGAGGDGFHASNSTYLKPFKQANKRKSYTPKKAGSGKKQKVQKLSVQVSKTADRIRRLSIETQNQKQQKK